MSGKVADPLWEMLANAGVKRRHGIIGDGLSPVIDGPRAGTRGSTHWIAGQIGFRDAPRRPSCGSLPYYFCLPSGSSSPSAPWPSRSSGCPVASPATPDGFFPRRERIFSSTSFSAFSNSSRFAILVDRLPIAPSCHNAPTCSRIQ